MIFPENVASQVESDLESYGIRIKNFFVSAVTITPDDSDAAYKIRSQHGTASG
jgi:hypothetical protein